ncbi:thioredoxin-like domain-containing protein [Lutibacter sp.]|uniref:thioredoxin-like domain-containing protein n=1 Tax=Lutibacter sp. TaxID=1925666 RepID=UPI0035675C7F
MKKLIYFLSIVLVVVSCKDEPKDYVTLSGKIIDKNSDSVVVRSREFSKTIKVNADGTFADTLKVVTGVYNFFDGNESTTIYLKNGFELVVSLDTKQFDESISYTGIGAEVNNYLAARALKQEEVFDNNNLFALEKPAFDQKMNEIKSDFMALLTTTENLDSLFIEDEKKGIDGFTLYIADYYAEKQYLNTFLAKGKASPKFTDYENFKGGTTSLDDLKGKYVYVDVWATWCAPCRAEIPFLKELEKAYRGKNIQFVSVSIDKAKDHDKWKKMVADEQLEGVQLFADNDWKSQFVTDYKVSGIPRFILIDPQGNIVTPEAPRPSSEDLKTLFDELKI